jgi:hypothetical protein
MAWNADLGVLRGPLRHWRGVAGEEESQCARIAAKRAVKQALERDKPSRLDTARRTSMVFGLPPRLPLEPG